MKQILSFFLCGAVLAVSAFSQSAAVTSREVYAFAGPPLNGTNEIDTLTIQTSTSAGTFTLSVADGRTTAAITWSATDATLLASVDAALEALPNIGVGGVTTAAGTLSSGIGTITITFTGKNSRMDFPLLSIGTNALTGGTAPTITTTTAGVAGTWRDAPNGTLIEDSTNGQLYQNVSSTAFNADWKSVAVNKQTTYIADGAIAIRSGQVILDKSSALAMTVAAPTAEQAGTRMTITNNNDVAHVVTFTGTTLLDGTTGANITATFAAFKGSSITVVAVNLKWHVESLQVVTAAP